MKSIVKKNRFVIILVLLAFFITIAIVLSGAYISEGYTVSIDEPSDKLIKSPRKIENKIATERNKEAAEAAAQNMKPLLKLEQSINDVVLERISEFVDTIFELRKAHVDFFVPSDEESSETASPNANPLSLPKLTVALTDEQVTKLLSMDTASFNTFNEDLIKITSVVLEAGVQEVDTKTLLFLRGEIQKLIKDAALEEIAYKIIPTFLEPNYVVDDEATFRARKERAEDYEIIYYLKGQTIVNEGDIITKEAYSALDSLGLISKSFYQNLVPVFGVTFIVLISFILVLSYIYYFNPSMVGNRKETLLFFTLYLSCIVITRFFVGLNYQVIPILVFTLLTAILLDARLAVVFNLCLTLICMYIYRGGLDFLIFYSLSGICISILSKHTTERNKILLVGIVVSLFNFVISFGIYLLLEKEYSIQALYNSILSALSGIFVVVIAIGSLPFWEATFGIVTMIKLLDLINPNNPILRRMTIEATGTYNHSLIVANLAETAAADIGANPILARVGGYFHDIGKLRYPQYFSENQLGTNPHDEMDPFSSAQVIQSHVSYGLELAETHKLPKVIKDIIEQHHGNTLVQYFLYKYQEANPEIKVNEKEFRYPYSIPNFKEAAIIMLADTVEAAVRSIDPANKTQDEIETFVSILIKNKLDDGQLTDSFLTLKDIKTIANSFMRVFKGMYHHRVAYPTAKKPPQKSQ